MNLSVQVMGESAGRMATTRHNREAARQGGFDRPDRRGQSLRLGMIFKIPVGYQDETGFHRGEPRMEKSLPVLDPEKNETNAYQF
jgi:hypothetical protein